MKKQVDEADRLRRRTNNDIRLMALLMYGSAALLIIVRLLS